jgi:predicted RNA-binding protein YlxR (DUF448 family)
VRLAFEGSRLVVDTQRRLPGRGAYVHPRPACVTIPGLARSLKRAVSRADVERIVASLALMSRPHDNSEDRGEGGDHPDENAPGLAGGDTVETPPRIKAKDDRSEDARV